MTAPAAGQRVGGYRLVRRIAVGGMGEVFEARPEDGGEPVVLKVLLPQHAEAPEFLEMFSDEARLACRLHHPGLVRVHEAGRDGGTLFMVMERVDGPTLAQALETGGPVPPALALEVARRLLEALEYLHGLTDEHGRPLEVVHRDVTPGNVLLSRDGEVKLSDFGIARHRLRTVRTRTGVIKGTVQYLSPEQVAGGPEVDARADLYGVGLILFELLTGRAFIHAEREIDLLRLAEDPPWTAPSSLNQDLDPALDRLLRPALKRFPEERYPGARSFLEARGRGLSWRRCRTSGRPSRGRRTSRTCRAGSLPCRTRPGRRPRRPRPPRPPLNNRRRGAGP